MNDTIILIGGPPCTGKSTLAQRLSSTLGIPWISTDQIRSIMQKTVRKEDYPNLFDTVGVSGEAYWSKKTSKQAITHQNNESKDVWKGVVGFIRERYPWRSFVIEGVALLPHLVHEKMLIDERLKAVFIVDHNKERLREIINTRGLWDYAPKYSDTVKPQELQWLLAFNEWFMKEARTYNLPVISVDDREQAYTDVVKVLDL